MTSGGAIGRIPEWCPIVIPYLTLPPGWRFQIAPDDEDVWFDEGLLNSQEPILHGRKLTSSVPRMAEAGVLLGSLPDRTQAASYRAP